MNPKKVRKISEMKNLGLVSQKKLDKVGIHTESDLRSIGANKAFKKMKDAGLKPHVCFLYAMIGAIENIHWVEVARIMKVRE